MNRGRWWLVIALVLSIGANVGLLIGRGLETRSQPTDPGPLASVPIAEAGDRLPPRYQRVVQRMANELRLDDSRRASFVDIHSRFFHRTRLGRERVRRSQAALRAELLAAAPDRQRAERLSAELAAAHAELEQAFVATFFETIALLDAEQGLRYRRVLGQLRRFQNRGADRGERPRPPWRRSERSNHPPAVESPPDSPER